jgi:hypothetical protein
MHFPGIVSGKRCLKVFGTEMQLSAWLSQKTAASSPVPFFEVGLP